MSEMNDDLLGHQLPPDNITNHQLYVLLLNLNSKLTLTNGRMAEMQRQYDIRTAMLDKQSLELEFLREAWDNAAGVVRFVKIMGMIATAVAAMTGLIKLLKGT